VKKIKGIIFDLDGTLANTLPLCIQAFRQSIEPLTLTPLSDAEIIATFGPSEEGTIMTLVPEHYDKGIISYLSFYNDLHDMCPEPFPDVRGLLDLLRNKAIHTAMVTGKGTHSTKISLERFGLGSYFEIVETGSPNGPRKVEGIKQVLAHWSTLHKDEILYIGDAPSDTIASRIAGITMIAAAWAPTAEPDKLAATQPDEIFHSVKDFTDWLLLRI
jgi:phosphoglycolate phosphatase/pyrophosphatase PpaX